jgi:DNA-binding response OmpR family regulator
MPAPTEATASQTLPPIVLVVEEDDEVREMYETALEASGMWASSVARTDEALSYAEDIRPDAIVSDISLAAGSGIDLAERLRLQDRTCRIPIVALTGGDPTSLNVLPGLFDDVIQKPVEVAVLIARIRAVIARAQEVRARANHTRQNIPDMLARSQRLIERSQRLRQAGTGTAQIERLCPTCARPLEWVERRQMFSVVFDYYRACAAGCGLFCYDHAQRRFITLIGR